MHTVAGPGTSATYYSNVRVPVTSVVGAETYPVCSRQVEELLAWRKAGEWPHVVLAVGGISTVERARHLLREGANAVLVATAALTDPLFALRFRQAVTTAVA